MLNIDITEAQVLKQALEARVLDLRLRLTNQPQHRIDKEELTTATQLIEKIERLLLRSRHLAWGADDVAFDADRKRS